MINMFLTLQLLLRAVDSGASNLLEALVGHSQQHANFSILLDG